MSRWVGKPYYHLLTLGALLISVLNREPMGWEAVAEAANLHVVHISVLNREPMGWEATLPRMPIAALSYFSAQP